MKIAVRYHTRSGNTQRLAAAAADALSVTAGDMTVPLEERVDILFLGCSYYAFDVDEAVKRYLEENCSRIGKIVCFGTSAMMRSMKKPIAKIAAPLNIPVAEEELHCRGSFGPLHKGRPDAEDLAAAAAFVRNVAERGLET